MVGGGIPVAIHPNVTGSVPLTTYPAKLSLGKIISGITVREIIIANHTYIHTYRQTYALAEKVLAQTKVKFYWNTE